MMNEILYFTSALVYAYFPLHDSGRISDLNHLPIRLLLKTIGFGAALPPRSPKSNRQLLLGDLGRAAPNPIVYKQ